MLPYGSQDMNSGAQHRGAQITLGQENRTGRLTVGRKINFYFNFSHLALQVGGVLKLGQ
jgi:hypothetical protein